MAINRFFNKNYVTSKEAFIVNDFLGLINKFQVLNSFPAVSTNTNANFNFLDQSISGSLDIVRVEIQSINGDLDYRTAGVSFSINVNPTKSLNVNANAASKVITVNSNNLSKPETDEIWKLVSELFPFASDYTQNNVIHPGMIMPILSDEFKAYLSRKQNTTNEVFVIMSFNEEHRDSYYIAIKPTLNKLGFKTVRVDEIQHNNTVTKEIYEAIERSAFVIADLTGERPNVYFEVGWAYKAGKEVVLIARKGTSVHFDVAAINRIDYKDYTDLAISLKKRVKQIAKDMQIDLPK